MEKQILESKRLGERYIRAAHPSGLTILLYPMPEFSTVQAMFAANYGSVDNCFKTPDDPDFVQVPDGIAHFLEHKLFESEDGDAFTLFAATGADANAYTSFDKTCYYFSCSDKFEESLSALLGFVQTPYFTQETVEKEQGIIGQEIRMYDDSPSWQVMVGLLQCLYHRNPVRVDIAGTAESIAQIDAALLHRCYRAFYNLSNMTLAIAGNFDPDRTLELIESSLKPGKPAKVACAPYDEPDGLASKRAERRMEVSLPLFYFGCKLRPEENAAGFLRQQYELEILLDLLSGSTSDFYEEMVREGLLNNGFSSEVFAGRGFLSLICGGESRDPDRVMNRFLEVLAAAQQNGLSEEDFLSCKNAFYGRMVRALNNVDNTASALLGSEMSGLGLFDSVELLADVTLEGVTARLAGLSTDSFALSLVLPQG